MGALATQKRLDRTHLREVAVWSRELRLLGLDPSDPLARAVMPMALRLSRQTIEVNLEWTKSRTERYGLDLVVGGRIVTTFAEAVYGSEESRSDRLTVELVAVPVAGQ